MTGFSSAYSGSFDKAAFLKGYTHEFKNVPKFNLTSLPDLLFVLGKIGADPRITDLRWSAYMLATVFVESSHTVRTKKQIVDKNGRVKLQSIKVWRTFAPVEEAGHGKGLKYYLPVEVKRLANGDVRVTEHDGDQWVISPATAYARDLHLSGNGRECECASQPRL